MTTLSPARQDLRQNQVQKATLFEFPNNNLIYQQKKKMNKNVFGNFQQQNKIYGNKIFRKGWHDKRFSQPNANENMNQYGKTKEIPQNQQQNMEGVFSKTRVEKSLQQGDILQSINKQRYLQMKQQVQQDYHPQATFPLKNKFNSTQNSFNQKNEKKSYGQDEYTQQHKLNYKEQFNQTVNQFFQNKEQKINNRQTQSQNQRQRVLENQFNRTNFKLNKPVQYNEQYQNQDNFYMTNYENIDYRDKSHKYSPQTQNQQQNLPSLQNKQKSKNNPKKYNFIAQNIKQYERNGSKFVINYQKQQQHLTFKQINERTIEKQPQLTQEQVQREFQFIQQIITKFKRFGIQSILPIEIVLFRKIILSSNFPYNKTAQVIMDQINIQLNQQKFSQASEIKKVKNSSQNNFFQQKQKQQNKGTTFQDGLQQQNHQQFQQTNEQNIYDSKNGSPYKGSTQLNDLEQLKRQERSELHKQELQRQLKYKQKEEKQYLDYLRFLEMDEFQHQQQLQLNQHIQQKNYIPYDKELVSNFFNDQNFSYNDIGSTQLQKIIEFQKGSLNQIPEQQSKVQTDNNQSIEQVSEQEDTDQDQIKSINSEEIDEFEQQEQIQLQIKHENDNQLQEGIEKINKVQQN